MNDDDMNEHDKREDQPQRAVKGWFWLGAGALLFALMFYLAYGLPGARIGPKQPIPFSHRVHAGVKQINCRFCHPYVERSQNAGLPSVDKCFFCHQYVIPDHPEIQKEKHYLDTKTPVPWKRVFYVPDFVFFRHEPHVSWAGLDCGQCHGNVNEQDRLPDVQFQMGFCVTCHRKMGAQLDCWLACHR